MTCKHPRLFKWLIFLALFLFGLFCYMKDYGYCAEPQFSYSYHVPLEDEYLYQNYECRSNWQAKPGRQQAPSHSQRQQWQEAYDNHHFNAVRTYNDAYNRVWWLPDLTWRQIGRDCWVTACALASTKTPSTALVVAFSTLLSQYGLHCLDEWDYINEKLYWAQYHFEQCALYAGKLNS